MTQASRLHVVGDSRPAPSPPAKTPGQRPAAPEPLWREVLGAHLRELRQRHEETLVETAARAGISPQYLSEVERGLKEPSSEMIAAVAGALGTTLGGLAESVAEDLRDRRETSLVLQRAITTMPTMPAMPTMPTMPTRRTATAQILALAA